MGKICIGAGSVALSAFGTYAIIASTLGGQNPPWYLVVLLWLSLCALTVFLITGIIYLYKLIWGKKLEIDIHDSKVKSDVGCSDEKITFKIAFVLKTLWPPISIARIQLCMSDMKLDSVDGSYKIESRMQSVVATFMLPNEYYSIRPLKIEGNYYLSIFALGREWKSQEFNLNIQAITIHVPTAHAIALAFPGEVQIKQSKIDNEHSRN